MNNDEDAGAGRFGAALKKFVVESEQNIDHLRHRLRERIGRGGEVSVLPYRGHGNSEEVLFQGRVLEGAPDETPTADDSGIANLVAMYRRFGTTEVAGARVRLTYDDRQVDLHTDSEGYFRHVVRPGAPTGADEWQHARVEVIETPWGEPTKKADQASALVPSATASFGVISDVDDTILISNARKRLQMILLTLRGNAASRLPFQGVASLYGGLRDGPDGAAANPFFYVSSSPWNLYDFLEDFFRLNGLPDGPFFLKDFGIGEEAASLTDHEEHKLSSISEVLELHSSLDFVLMGDSGERDPEIYSEIVHRYPDRVRAVVIRDGTDPDRDSEVRRIMAALEVLGVAAVLASDSEKAAVVLSDVGLVAKDTPTRVRMAMDRASDRENQEDR